MTFSTPPVNIFEVSATRSSLRNILTHPFGLRLRPAMVTLASRLPSADRPVPLAPKCLSHSGRAAVSDAIVQTQIPSLESSPQHGAPQGLLSLNNVEAPRILTCSGPITCPFESRPLGLFPCEAPATVVVCTCLCQLEPRWVMPWECLQKTFLSCVHTQSSLRTRSRIAIILMTTTRTIEGYRRHKAVQQYNRQCYWVARTSPYGKLSIIHGLNEDSFVLIRIVSGVAILFEPGSRYLDSPLATAILAIPESGAVVDHQPLNGYCSRNLRPIQ